ncbi:GGDEF domain-containing protein [Micromonospora antibiotica]|uniref:Diguanylate cyclase n=1 Tax=Micromonospora antibiotica TaxID=2807623 RepID=A0ABS3VGX7_9ACTN|nr:diguanylate cyclase [Micromonospora antibiotica]MBO4164881.1 diguanylate cyclase [Micromonospora antibiotica]
MTLRGRLTAAFLTVVLGPVLLGAVLVGTTLSTVDRTRSTERLGLAASAVRTSIDALCQQLRAAADAVALRPDPATRAGAAGQVVSRGLATAVLVTDVTGGTTYATPGGPATPWQDCAGVRTGGPVRALSARVDLRDPAGTPLGAVAAAEVVDPAFVARLAAATGVAVTLLDDTAGPDRITHTTETRRVRDAVLAAAGTLDGDRVTATRDGRYVRRLGPAPGQPLPLVLSVAGERPSGLPAALVGAVLLAVVVAVLTAWRLARVTTRPLVELAGAVDRVARGDLTARVPVRSRDEIGGLAAAFNRMIRETAGYVAALTSSRDQLRGHLRVLGDTLASTHDLQRILRVILHSAIAATGARAGAVLLVDDAGVLVGQCAEGLAGRCPPGTEPEELRVPVGTGVVGAVAATGEPQRGRVPPGPTPTGEPWCETYVAVPFTAPGGDAAGRDPAVGVLVLYDRLGVGEFDDDDLATLRTFAGHAAVAVENVRVHEEAQRLSLTDPLTGLWNYRYLRESLRREVERASRFGRMLSILVLDLDRFKTVNDSYGHAAGDAVLAEFARRVRGEIREVDLAFRQGGEEFVVLLPETDARGAATVAERLGAAVREAPVVVAGHAGVPTTIAVSVSIGIAVYPDHACTGAEVLDAADEALYAAKGAGRDGYRVATARPRPTPAADGAVEEIAVPAGATSPDDGLPRAGPPVGPTSATRPPAHRPPTDRVAGDDLPTDGSIDLPADGSTGGPAGRHAVGAPGVTQPGGASSGPHPPRQSRGR